MVVHVMKWGKKGTGSVYALPVHFKLI